MDNKDIANEIAQKYARVGVDVTNGKPTRNMLYHCALEMAERKDTEFSARVLKALGCDTCALRECEECSFGRVRELLHDNVNEKK